MPSADYGSGIDTRSGETAKHPASAALNNYRRLGQRLRRACAHHRQQAHTGHRGAVCEQFART